MNKLREEILNLIDFTCGKTFNETHGLKKVEIYNNVVSVELYIENDDKENTDKTKKALIRLVKLNLGYDGIKIKFIPASDKNTVFDNDCKFIMIASGKGGVGKSNVTANLGYALSRQEKKVGIIDADIYGASIPNVLGLPKIDVRGDEAGNLLPFEAYEMQIVSTDFFMEGNKPLMWRGPMLGKMLDHFFHNTTWDKNLDYILIDLPPGTGDVAIDLGNMVPNGKMIVITTPHPNASHIAIKAGLGAKEMKLEVLGVVENMSYYINPVNGQKDYIFGEGGGKKVSKELSVPLLANIPIGQPKNFLFTEIEEIGKIYDELAKKIIKIS